MLKGLFAAILLLGGCAGRDDKFAAVDAELRRSLPLGMTASEVARALDAKGIAHSPIRAESRKMRSLVGSLDKGVVTRVDAQFEMLFDSTGRLTEISSKKVYTGP
ncbi:MAG: hypothetical protein NVS1B4_24930 [Gemmatimonadaceae bacterium]